MASSDNTQQQEHIESNADHPSSTKETASSPAHHYQHQFPFTIVPNCFIDVYVPRLSPTAQSVMLVFYRLTLGCHRADTFISLNELRQRTGIASFATLNDALKELLAARLITVSEQRGQRGLKGYCLTSVALSSTESVELNQAHPSHNVRFLHTTPDDHASSSTDSVAVPLQKLTQNLYRNRNSTSTESVEVISSRHAQGAVPDKPKESVKKAKDTGKEIVRYERQQNERQEESEENTNTRSPAAFLTRLLEQHTVAHETGKAASPHRDERRDAPHAPVSTQPSRPLEGNPPTPTTLPIQQAPAPNAAERTRPDQTQRHLPTSEEVADLATRRLRLLALQQELAQLKRTPSMQLLARQRIPRLEEAIKHLIASLAASA